jgi:predicted transcriptional regulator
MLETRDESYKKLIENNNLSLSQNMILSYIMDNPKLSRQSISERMGLTINSVCGRVKELIDLGLIIEDGQRNGQGLLRIREKEDKLIVPKYLTEVKFENLLKHIRESMEIANEFQKNKIKSLVQQWN